MNYLIFIIIVLTVLVSCAPLQEEPVSKGLEPAKEIEPTKEVPTKILEEEEAAPEVTEADVVVATTWITDLTCENEQLIFTWNNIRDTSVSTNDLKFHANGVLEEPKCESDTLEAKAKTVCTVNTYVFGGRLNIAMIIDENRKSETAKVFCEQN